LSQYKQYLDFAINIAKRAGDIHLSYFGNISSLKTKSNNIDLVTKADIDSEKYIISQIELNFPNHSILSEEKGNINKNSKFTWVIDPLDGTTNFAHNLPIFSVSIGLMKNNNIICGVVYNPAANKCFYAEKNKGAFLNNSQIMCTKTKKLKNTLLATGFPYLHDDRYDISFDIFKEFYDKTRGIRRLGAASLDLCFVAMGRFDGFYEFELRPWDICAGSLIVTESGGIVTDWDGEKLPKSGKRILATNKFIHKQMKAILKKNKYKLFF